MNEERGTKNEEGSVVRCPLFVEKENRRLSTNNGPRPTDNRPWTTSRSSFIVHRSSFLAALVAGVLALAGASGSDGQVAPETYQENLQVVPLPLPSPLFKGQDSLAGASGSELVKEPPTLKGGIVGRTIATIDLPTALRLAGVENPQIILARQRVLYATAIRQFAAAQLLPTLNAGLNFDNHLGPLQQSSGNILSVNRNALYVGAGANAVAAGTVSIPGVVYNMNLANTWFGILASRQLVREKRFAAQAVQNESFRQVAVAYLDLLHAEAGRSVAYLDFKEARRIKEIADLRVQGRLINQANADRIGNELERRAINLTESEGQVQAASARLAQLLNLDPALRLHPAEDRLVPQSMVPDAIPLAELIAIAMLQRPELAANQAAIRQAMLKLSNARLLPFAPNMIVGFSDGTFGGGSNFVAGSGGFGAPGGQPRFDNFSNRNDFDVIAYWTLQNLGVGNIAQIREMASKLRTTELERVVVLNRVREEVANADIRRHVRMAQIIASERAVQTGMKALEEDFLRVFQVVKRALPIELLASLRLLDRARYEYLEAITDYNKAQLELFVALGQPPADVLARPVPRQMPAADIFKKQ